MVINVKISLCSITRASKLFQRNYYLPLLKPLSPKDALRRKIITGQNVLGSRYEHYIPCLQSHGEKSSEKKSRPKGAPVVKKRVKMSSKMKYVAPFIDEDMENHPALINLLMRKGKGKGQHYIYEVLDKNCILVLNYQMEKSIKDKDIIDVIMAQRSEKIVIKLKNNMRITLPLAPYDSAGPLYHGSGWTREHIDEEHHHGKETMSKAKLFEAKESGVEEWELEMMRLANKRKKKAKGCDKPEWKNMMAAAAEAVDWEQFEEDSKQIVEEIHEIVEEENIPMAVDDMEKTKNVIEKLKSGGIEVLSQLPDMSQIPEVIKNMENGELTELVGCSGISLKMSNGQTCFIVGQMVTNEQGEVFVPGQSVFNEDDETFDYVPGVTILMDDEPTLIPGLVMGEQNTSAMFLPGESTITGDGQLRFEGTEADFNPNYKEGSPGLPFPDDEPEPEREEEPIVEKRWDDPIEPVVKHRVKKKPRAVTPPPPIPERIKPYRYERPPIEDPRYVLASKLLREQEEEAKKMKERDNEKKGQIEYKVDKLRLAMHKKAKEIKFEVPEPFEPVEPVEKSLTLVEMEEDIKKGSFLEDEPTKAVMDTVKELVRESKYRRSKFDPSEFEYRRFF